MAEIKTVMSIVATVSDRVKDLPIENGQLIFVHDVGRLAWDYRGKRTFYNQIVELETEQERTELSSPVNGKYYFVIETAILWRYFNGWKQLTSSPGEVLFIGTELPQLGQINKVYINKDVREIYVWDEENKEYIPVANYTGTMSVSDIDALF